MRRCVSRRGRSAWRIRASFCAVGRRLTSAPRCRRRRGMLRRMQVLKAVVKNGRLIVSMKHAPNSNAPHSRKMRASASCYSNAPRSVRERAGRDRVGVTYGSVRCPAYPHERPIAQSHRRFESAVRMQSALYMSSRDRVNELGHRLHVAHRNMSNAGRKLATYDDSSECSIAMASPPSWTPVRTSSTPSRCVLGSRAASFAARGFGPPGPDSFHPAARPHI